MDGELLGDLQTYLGAAVQKELTAGDGAAAEEVVSAEQLLARHSLAVIFGALADRLGADDDAAVRLIVRVLDKVLPPLLIAADSAGREKLLAYVARGLSMDSQLVRLTAVGCLSSGAASSPAVRSELSRGPRRRCPRP
jgi:hypothetical protein